MITISKSILLFLRLLCEPLLFILQKFFTKTVVFHWHIVIYRIQSTLLSYNFHRITFFVPFILLPEYIMHWLFVVSFHHKHLITQFPPFQLFLINVTLLTLLSSWPILYDWLDQKRNAKGEKNNLLHSKLHKKRNTLYNLTYFSQKVLLRRLKND